MLLRFFLFLLSLSLFSCRSSHSFVWCYCGSQCASMLCLAFANPAHIKLHHWPFPPLIQWLHDYWAYAPNLMQIEGKNLFGFFFVSSLFLSSAQSICCSVSIFIDVSVLFQPLLQRYPHTCMGAFRNTEQTVHTGACIRRHAHTHSVNGGNAIIFEMKEWGKGIKRYTYVICSVISYFFLCQALFQLNSIFPAMNCIFKHYLTFSGPLKC